MDDLHWTFALLAAGVALATYCRWYESRPRELGEVRLFPSTALMALGLLAGIVALAHLVTILTGVPPGSRGQV